jgi:hypothetical protein
MEQRNVVGTIARGVREVASEKARAAENEDSHAQGS